MGAADTETHTVQPLLSQGSGWGNTPINESLQWIRERLVTGTKVRALAHIMCQTEF